MPPRASVLTHADVEMIGNMVGLAVENSLPDALDKALPSALDKALSPMRRGFLIAGGLPVEQAIEREPES